MAFGQQSGPPATGKQVQELLALLQEAGHSDFRDARGPMGFNQRQAGGKFSRDEAAAFIEQLQNDAEQTDDTPPPANSSSRAVAPKSRPSATEQALAKFTTAQLAAEVQRRGWIVVEP
jgi:hypothetical protein